MPKQLYNNSALPSKLYNLNNET